MDFGWLPETAPGFGEGFASDDPNDVSIIFVVTIDCDDGVWARAVWS